MITCNMEQGSPAWHHARLGLPTASTISALVTPTGKATTGTKPNTYLQTLLTQRFAGFGMGDFKSKAMERGHALEPQARGYYSMLTGRTVSTVGFVFRDEARDCGCSPDGMMLADEIGLEIKCPMPKQHIKVLVTDDPRDYMPQVQYTMWITGYKVWDLLLYTDNDRIPSKVFSVSRDARFMIAFDEVVPPFIKKLEEETKRLEAMGAVRIGQDWDIMNPEYD